MGVFPLIPHRTGALKKTHRDLQGSGEALRLPQKDLGTSGTETLPCAPAFCCDVTVHQADGTKFHMQRLLLCSDKQTLPWWLPAIPLAF